MVDPLDQRHLLRIPIGGPQLYRTYSGEYRSVAPGQLYYLVSHKPTIRLHIPPFNEDNDDSDSEVDCDEPPQPYKRRSVRRGSRAPSPDVSTEDLDSQPGAGHVLIKGHAELDIVSSYHYNGHHNNTIDGPVDGTEVIHFYRCPGDYGEKGTWVEKNVRWPELVAVSGGRYRTRAIMEQMEARILILYEDSRHENQLVVDSDRKPCFPPCDENDLWARVYLAKLRQPAIARSIEYAWNMIVRKDACGTSRAVAKFATALRAITFGTQGVSASR
ncbi:uncharacterized protein SCHCODRAFT_01091234 [Schizophyllum commune H4-8]|nr:uncharacterized protein SCHCODRAFT_01091234 [Schizophyllum commune H4-8]KAI5895931.1 hypothetical protein SCHCODRAFT_01091234 [Schizophyllum commune H4-8]